MLNPARFESVMAGLDPAIPLRNALCLPKRNHRDKPGDDGSIFGRRRAMNADIAALLYLVAGVLFILALRGLSSPEIEPAGQSLRHDRHGDRDRHDARRASACRVAVAWLLVVVGIAFGGGIGALIARRVPMTAMPELVAAFHSLVGMAAVLVAAARALCADRVRHRHGRRHPQGEPRRNVARRRDRRRHLHRLDHRIPQVVRPHERRADHPARPAHHQHRARGRR